MSTTEYSGVPDFDEKPDASQIEQAQAAQAAAAALISSTTVAQAPTAADIVVPDTTVVLPGGLLVGEELLTIAEVRELTGEDEEALAKSGGNLYKFLATILERGVVKVGDKAASPTVLRNLLIGDRDALLLGVRRATFGNDVEVPEYSCPSCGELVGDISISLTDIPVKTLDDPLVRSFEVPLRKGVAVVNLPNGGDQQALFQNEKLTAAEQNTLLLSRVVESVNGKKIVTLKEARDLGVVDRKSILDALAKKQPGPQYDEVKFDHEACGEEVTVALTVMDLFRGL